jgi:hypothetical protein
MYDKGSATSPDCHLRTERSPAVDTVESGPAQSAIEILTSVRAILRLTKS